MTSSFGLGHYKCLLQTVKDWPMTILTDGGAPGAVRLGRAALHHKPGQRCTFGPKSDKSKFYEDFT